MISSDKAINPENPITSIQGPCGNSIFQPSTTTTTTTNDYDGVTIIPRINDEQLIIEERYSTIDGCFGTVRMIISKTKYVNILT